MGNTYPMVSDIGKRLRTWRASQRMSQHDLALRLSVSDRTIGNWERGGTIPPSALAQIEGLLGDDAAPDPDITVQYRGWTVSIQRNPGSTDEEVLAAIPRVLAALDATAGDATVDLIRPVRPMPDSADSG